MSNVDRIASFLNDEGCPKTPQEIAEWTGIRLSEVYEVLQGDMIFEQILSDDGNSLIGWIAHDTVMPKKIKMPEASPFAYNCRGD